MINILFFCKELYVQLFLKLQAFRYILFGQKTVSEVTTAIAEAKLIILIPASAPVGAGAGAGSVGLTTGS